MRPAGWLAILALAWVTLLLAAPSTLAGVPASAAVYALGGLICHQRPERSFHIAASQLPVCARCIGLYAGFASAALAAWLAARPPAAWRAPAPRALSGLRRLVLLGAVPTALTWSAEALGLWWPGNSVRFAAALPLGAAVAITVNYVGCARTPPSGFRPPPAPI